MTARHRPGSTVAGCANVDQGGRGSECTRIETNLIIDASKVSWAARRVARFVPPDPAHVKELQDAKASLKVTKEWRDRHVIDCDGAAGRWGGLR